MRNLRWLLGISVLLFALGLAACGGRDEPASVPESSETTSAPEASPAPTETQSPPSSQGSTASPEPGVSPGGEAGELDIADLSRATDLGSYRSTSTLYAEGIDNGQPIQGSIEFLTEYTREPLAQHIVISSQGFEGSEEALRTEMYVLQENTFMQIGDEWFSTPADDEPSLDDAGLVTTADMLDGTCGWIWQGTVEYHGLTVDHWTLTYEDLAACIPAEKLAQMGGITDASGDLYVTVDGNHIVHLVLVFQGQDLALGVGSAEDRVEEGMVRFTFEMTDVNQPFTIQVPEAALASGAMPEDIPVPEDAEQVSNLFGMITFLSASTPRQVADHFETSMPGHGWTQVSGDEFGGTLVLEYAKGGRTAGLMISIDEATGLTSVLITVEGE